MGGDLGMLWLLDLGTFGYLTAAIGLCSATALRRLSSSSGGVGSSGSVDSKLVSEPPECRTARGGYIGFGTLMAANAGLNERCGSVDMGVGSGSQKSGTVPASWLV